MLGYVLSAHDVLQYYGTPEVQQAIFEAGRDRDTVTVLDSGILSRGRGNAPGFSGAEDIPRIALQCLQSHPIPRKYPAFHGTVQKYRQTELFRRGRTPCGSDMVFDIDIKTNYRQAFQQGKKIADFLEHQKVTYRLKFSGGTGPHIILPCETFPQSFAANRFKRLFRTICERANVESESVDFSLTSPNHFLRLAYSLNETTGLISLPLSRDTLEAFEPGMAERSEVKHVDPDWLALPEDAPGRMEKFISDALGRRATS